MISQFHIKFFQQNMPTEYLYNSANRVLLIAFFRFSWNQQWSTRTKSVSGIREYHVSTVNDNHKLFYNEKT
jgi:hypothetical protein